VQVRIVSDSHLFDDAIRAALVSIAEISPLLWDLALRRQRDRSRRVTRRKQRRHW
jgi:hypothetical protein